MQYILLDIGYQEISNGVVVRYTDTNGNTIEPPVGYGGVVIDANPPQPIWAVPDVVVVQPTVAPRRISKLQFVERLGEAAFTTLLAMAHQSVDVEKFVKLIDWATPEADGTSIDLDDPRVQAVRDFEPILITAGKVSAGWADGVLNA